MLPLPFFSWASLCKRPSLPAFADTLRLVLMPRPEPGNVFALLDLPPPINRPRILFETMLRFVLGFLATVSVFWLGGCQNPALKTAPPRTSGPTNADWQNELAPGRTADAALGYLLTHGYDCRVSRNEKGEIETILATPNQRPRTGPTIDISIGAGKIQRVELMPPAGG